MSVMPTGKKFQLTANDVHYVFQIPIGPLPVPISNAHADSELKNTWKDLYGGAKHEVTVPQLVEVMTSNEGMRMGNDEFKKCFVMYSMITLLAPTSNRKADFKLVLALENVHLFQDYNWCQYVLDDLAEKLSSYSANQKYVPGCLLLLQICYFHRLRSRGNVLPSTLPLIQHLSDKDFRSRLADEDKVYGMADLDKVTYPVTKISNNNSKVLAIEAKKTEEKIDEMKFLENKKSAVEDNSVNDFPRVVTFNLPAGIESNEEIHMLAKNDVEEKYMLIKRDLKLFSHQFEQHIQSVRLQSEAVQIDSKLLEKERSPVLSQLDAIFNDSSFWDQIDKITNHAIAMKKLEDELPSFALFSYTNPHL